MNRVHDNLVVTVCACVKSHGPSHTEKKPELGIGAIYKSCKYAVLNGFWTEMKMSVFVKLLIFQHHII